MKKNKAYLIIFLFLFAESLSVFYIFNYTVRTRKPNQTYKSEGVINCFSISSSGRSLVIGSSNGLVSFFSENKLTPSWMYHSASEILFVALSPEGDYAVSLDGNDTINLFSSSPYIVQNEISPRWTYRLKNGAVSDVHSFGGIPPLVFILTTVEGQIKLLSNKGLVWEYMTGAPKVIAKMSFNGCWIAAADSKGRVYLFSVKSAVPIWVVSTELTNVSLFFSQNDNIAVGGLYRDGSGRIYILLLESGDIAWEWRTSEPIHFVSISSDGLNVIAYHEEEDVYIISKDGN
jgi:hypothetical protein